MVDDEQPIRQACCRVLEAHGYEVVEASNGAEAVALYADEKARPALVVLDMAMPVMDGPACILALRALDPGVRILASSGLTSAGDLTKAQQAGVSQFVAKPYTSESLLSAVSSILEHQKSSRK